MNKIFKFGLWGVAVVVGIAAAGAAYLAATFDPNAYKEKIIKSVKDKTQRNLRLDGDIKLSFWPNIGADISKVSLSEVKSDKEFAAIESARISLALIPLLKKQVIVDEVALSGVNAILIKRKDGSANIDDLLASKKNNTQAKPAKEEDATPIELDISSVSLQKTNLTYQDEVSGAQYALKELNLQTGRLTKNEPTAITLSTKVQANQPKLDIATNLETNLTIDLEAKRYRLQAMNMEASGMAVDITDLTMQGNGDVSADLTNHEFTVDKFSMKATGTKTKQTFEATLEAPAMHLTKDKLTGNQLKMVAKLDGESGTTVAALSLPDLQGTRKLFKTGTLTLDLDVTQPEQKFNMKLSSPITGNFEDQRFSLNDLSLKVNASGEKLPNESVSSEMKGNLLIDAAKQRIELDLAGGLLQSEVKAKVGADGFAKPAIQFDATVDQFDADLYLPKKSEKETSPKKTTTDAERPLDLSILHKLNLEGNLRIGALKIANVKSTKVRLQVKASNGQMFLSPLAAHLYDGRMEGSVNVNAQAIPKITIKQNLTGVNVAPLTMDAAEFDTLEGKGDVNVDITMQGHTVTQMKKKMNGTMSLNLADGAIKGINIAKKIRDAQSLVNIGSAKSETQSANSAEKTDFSELKATFKVSSGVAHNDDLSLKSPLLRMGGAGDINIGNNSMDYVAKATLAKTLEGQGGKDKVGGTTVPVRIKGPFSDLKYTLDFEAMASDAVKQKVEEKKEEVKTKLQEELKGRLPGLFK